MIKKLINFLPLIVLLLSLNIPTKGYAGVQCGNGSGELSPTCSDSQVCMKCSRTTSCQDTNNGSALRTDYGHCVDKSLIPSNEDNDINLQMSPPFYTSEPMEGHPYCNIITTCSISDGNFSIVMGQNKDFDRPLAPCLPLAKYNDYDVNKTGGECTFCSLFKVFFDTISKVAQKADVTFSKSMVPVVAVGFALWLVVYILGYLSSFETRDVKDAFQEIVTKGALVVVSVIILTNGSCNFYNTFINPVYETFLRGAKVALNVSLEGGGQLGAETAELSTSSASEGLPVSMKESIVGTMTAMERVISKLRALGSSLMCYSWEKAILYIIPRFSYLITGLFYWIMAMAMIVIVPFLMIDIVFELGVAVALLPFAIASYPFKQMRQYSKKVWETFLNSGFGFLFMALVIVMILAVFEQSVSLSMKEALGEESLGEDWGGLFSSSNNEDKMDTYLKSIAWFRGPFLQLLFCFVLAWSVMNLGKEFADEFASSISSTTIGSSVATMGFSSVKGMSKRVLSPIGNKASEKISHATAAAIRAPGKWVNSARMNGWKKKASQGVAQADGSMITTKGRSTYITTADGRQIKQSKRLFGLGTKTTEYSNINGIVAKTVSKKGTWFGMADGTKTSVSLQGPMAKAMFGADGSIDYDVYKRMGAGLSDAQREQLDKNVFGYISQSHFNGQSNGGRIVSQRFERDANGKMRQISVNADGETIITELDMRSPANGYKGRFMLSRARVKADGSTMILSTDGLQNKVEEFKSSGGSSIGEISANQVAGKHGSFERRSAVVQSRYYNAQTAQESLIHEDHKLYNAFGQYAGSINDRGEFIDKDGKVIARKMRDEEGNEMGRSRFGEQDPYSVKMGPDGHMRKFEYQEDGTIKWGDEVDNKPVIFEAVDGSGTFSFQNGRMTNKATGETYGGGRASSGRYDKQFNKANNLFNNM